MKFTKQVIDEIFKCYSVNALTISGETQLVFAAEGPGSCQIYSGPTFGDKKVLWDNEADVGGTMSVVTVPDHEGYFFVSKGFLSMVESETSGIYLIRYDQGTFVEERIFDIPYLHRFDVVTIGERRFLLAATLHGGKVDKADWSQPGRLYVAELPYDLSQPFQVELTVYKEGLYKNHGFNKGVWKDKEAVFVASEEGVLAVMPPQGDTDEWTSERVFDFPVSDVAAIDLDGDGEVEFAIMSPFHGNQFDVYKKIDGVYKSVFKYDKDLDFYHAIFADTYNGKPSFVIGARQEDMDLFLVQYDDQQGEFVSYIIDTEVGSSNAKIIHTEQGDLIMSANRQIGEAAIYK